LPQIPTHQTHVEISQSIPQVVEAGTDIALTVKVSCPSGCDLRGRPVTVMASDAVVMMRELATYDETINETEDFTLKVPSEVGEYAWSILFPRHETESTVHEESCLPIVFRTKPHTTSLAVWDTPSPVVVNSSFKVKVGIKCSAMCQLTGHLVEIRNEAGTKVGEGTLGETPWPGTGSLYWAEVALAAPAAQKVPSWTVTYAAAELGLPHDAASATFTFRTAKPPEHRVTIKTIAKKTGGPIADVEVRLGVYEVFTDESGLTTIAVPRGRYRLTIRKDGYEAQPVTVKVSKDTTIQVEALKVPTKAEIEEKMMRFEDYDWGRY
jgi:hypothetical protein